MVIVGIPVFGVEGLKGLFVARFLISQQLNDQEVVVKLVPYLRYILVCFLSLFVTNDCVRALHGGPATPVAHPKCTLARPTYNRDVQDGACLGPVFGTR